VNNFKVARVSDKKWDQFGRKFVQLGLPMQEFRVVDVTTDKVFVHPGDLTRTKGGPFAIRRDFVEFPEDS